jgi:hypothetical protein
MSTSAAAPSAKTSSQTASDRYPPSASEADEPSDEEILLRFQSDLRYRAAGYVYYHGESLSYEEALSREKADFIARFRAARAKTKAYNDDVDRQQAEARAKQTALETGAATQQARKKLGTALSAYQSLQATGNELRVQYAAAEKTLSELKTDTTTDLGKLKRSLTEAADMVSVLANRLDAHSKSETQAHKALQSATLQAKGEFTFLHRQKRDALVATATKAIAQVVDLYALSQILVYRSQVDSLADCAPAVLYLDHQVGFSRYTYNWPYSPSDDPVPLALDIEKRYSALEPFLK